MNVSQDPPGPRTGAHSPGTAAGLRTAADGKAPPSPTGERCAAVARPASLARRERGERGPCIEHLSLVVRAIPQLPDIVADLGAQPLPRIRRGVREVVLRHQPGVPWDGSAAVEPLLDRGNPRPRLPIRVHDRQPVPTQQLILHGARLPGEVAEDLPPCGVDLLGQLLSAGIGDAPGQVEEVVLRLLQISQWAATLVEGLEDDPRLRAGADLVDQELEPGRDPAVEVLQSPERLVGRAPSINPASLPSKNTAASSSLTCPDPFAAPT